MEKNVHRGADATIFRLSAVRVLPRSVSVRVEQHPRFQAMLHEFGKDDSWHDELMGKVKEPESITEIHVSLDEDYEKLQLLNSSLLLWVVRSGIGGPELASHPARNRAVSGLLDGTETT